MESPFVEAVYSAFPSLLPVFDDTKAVAETFDQDELASANGWSCVYRRDLGAIPITTEIVAEDRSLSFRAVVAFPKGTLDLCRLPESPGIHPQHHSLRIGRCHIEELSRSTMTGRRLGSQGLGGKLLCYASSNIDDHYDRLSIYSINNDLTVSRLLGLKQDGSPWCLADVLKWSVEVTDARTYHFQTPVELYGILDAVPAQFQERGLPLSLLRLALPTDRSILNSSPGYERRPDTGMVSSTLADIVSSSGPMMLDQVVRMESQILQRLQGSMSCPVVKAPETLRVGRV